MAVVSVAIVISFHLKHPPSKFERQMALPLGLVFWLLALACLAAGFGNYIKAVTKYSRREALVQSGWKTQTVRCDFVSSCAGRSTLKSLCLGFHRRGPFHRHVLHTLLVYQRPSELVKRI